MHPNISELTRLMPPGEGEQGGIDWVEASSRWGTEFPTDYREFLSLYGGGAINNSFNIAVPLQVPGEGWLPQSCETLTPGGLQLLEDAEPEYSLGFSGSISWALDCAANYAYWDTSNSNPDNWTVVVLERHGEYSQYDCGMSGFLLAMLERGDFEPPMALFSPERPIFLNWRTERQIRLSNSDPWPHLQED